MSVSSLRIAVRAYSLLRSLAIAILLVPASAFAAPVPTGGPIAVNMDQAKLIRLPERAATIVIGNPLVADITLQPGGIIIVTGKSYGATNFVAMDRNGEVLLDRIILVEGAADPIVTVYRGIEREILQLHADLPAAHYARRQRAILQIDARPGRRAERPGRRRRRIQASVTTIRRGATAAPSANRNIGRKLHS